MDTKACAYCGKEIEQSKEVERVLLFIRGSQLAKEPRRYCSEKCAEHDQMAHEP